MPTYLKGRAKDCSLPQEPPWAFAAVAGQWAKEQILLYRKLRQKKQILGGFPGSWNQQAKSPIYFEIEDPNPTCKSGRNVVHG